MAEYLSTLTWTCIQLQGSLEDPNVDEDIKEQLVKEHLTTIQNTPRDPLPEFDPGLEWFNVSHELTVASDLVGRITVLDFFTYCCINCMHILPDLAALEKLHPPQSGVVIIGIHSAKFENEKVSSNISAAVQRYEIHHPVVNDTDAVYWNQLGITCWPTLLILGPDAKPIFLIIGEGHSSVLFHYIQSSLNFYKEKVQPWTHPLQLGSKSFTSHLRFPGKLCLMECGGEQKLVISDTGHHRILVVSLQGIIEKKIGGSEAGFNDGNISSARFCQPQGVVFKAPSTIYVADTGNHSVREIDLKSEIVSTVAGNGKQSTDKEGGHFGRSQGLASPWDLCLVPSPSSDVPGDVLLIANAGTHQIWALALAEVTWWKNQKLEPGRCVRVAGSGAEENRNNSYPAKASFAQPSGLCLAFIGAPGKKPEHLLFVADSESSSIRQVNLQDGQVKGVVGGDRDPTNLFRYGDKDNGDDPKSAVLLQHPLGVTWNSDDQSLYVADSYNHKIKKVDPLRKTCVTLLGDGHPGSIDGRAGETVRLNEPGGLYYCFTSRSLYVADTNNHNIRRFDLTSGVMETVKLSEPAPRVCGGPADISESALVPASNAPEIEWNMKFHCPDEWKWSADAPQRWTIELPDGFRSAELKGDAKDGQVRLKFQPPLSLTAVSSIRVRIEFYLCAVASGVCTRKSLTIALNVQPTDQSVSPHLSHEFALEV